MSFLLPYPSTFRIDLVLTIRDHSVVVMGSRLDQRIHEAHATTAAATRVRPPAASRLRKRWMVESAPGAALHRSSTRP
jgi:hypothetical protein